MHHRPNRDPGIMPCGMSWRPRQGVSLSFVELAFCFETLRLPNTDSSFREAALQSPWREAEGIREVGSLGLLPWSCR